MQAERVTPNKTSAKSKSLSNSFLKKKAAHTPLKTPVKKGAIVQSEQTKPLPEIPELQNENETIAKDETTPLQPEVLTETTTEVSAENASSDVSTKTPMDLESKLEQIKNSMPTFLESFRAQAEKKRKDEHLRFKCFQECVVQLSRNLELEKQKREATLKQLSERLEKSFETVLSSSTAEALKQYENVTQVLDASASRLSIIEGDLAVKDERILKLKTVFEKLTASASETANLLENSLRTAQENGTKLLSWLTESMKQIETRMASFFAEMKREIHSLEVEISGFDAMSTESEESMKGKWSDSVESLKQQLDEEEEERRTHIEKIVETIEMISQKIQTGCLLTTAS